MPAVTGNSVVADPEPAFFNKAGNNKDHEVSRQITFKAREVTRLEKIKVFATSFLASLDPDYTASPGPDNTRSLAEIDIQPIEMANQIISALIDSACDIPIGKLFNALTSTGFGLAAITYIMSRLPPTVAGEHIIPLDSTEDINRIGVDVHFPLNGHYLLTRNLSAEGIRSIGGVGHEFTGHFDGNGKVLDGLRYPLVNVGKNCRFTNMVIRNAIIDSDSIAPLLINGDDRLGILLRHGTGISFSTITFDSCSLTSRSRHSCAGFLAGSLNDRTQNRLASITIEGGELRVTGDFTSVGGLYGWGYWLANVHDDISVAGLSINVTGHYSEVGGLLGTSLMDVVREEICQETQPELTLSDIQISSSGDDSFASAFIGMTLHTCKGRLKARVSGVSIHVSGENALASLTEARLDNFPMNWSDSSFHNCTVSVAKQARGPGADSGCCMYDSSTVDSPLCGYTDEDSKDLRFIPTNCHRYKPTARFCHVDFINQTSTHTLNNGCNPDLSGQTTTTSPVASGVSQPVSAATPFYTHSTLKQAANTTGPVDVLPVSPGIGALTTGSAIAGTAIIAAGIAGSTIAYGYYKGKRGTEMITYPFTCLRNWLNSKCHRNGQSGLMTVSDKVQLIPLSEQLPNDLFGIEMETMFNT